MDYDSIGRFNRRRSLLKLQEVLMNDLSSTLQTVDSASITPVTVDAAVKQLNGAQQLTDAAVKAITGAHDLAIQNIDEMISLLQSVKASISAQRDNAGDGIKDFVNTVGIGLHGVQSLRTQIDKLVANHIAK
jgi:hypothetical protein